MPEFRIIHRGALEHREAVTRHGVRIEALPEGTVLHLLARQSSSKRPPVHVVAGYSLRSVSVGQWFAVRDGVLEPAERDAIADALTPDIDIVDQSHGRIGLVVHGPQARRVLAKGTAIDLAPEAFSVGQSAMTLIGHIAAHLTRTDEDRFEILVLRGFAESLWDDLVGMSLEFS